MKNFSKYKVTVEFELVGQENQLFEDYIYPVGKNNLTELKFNISSAVVKFCKDFQYASTSPKLTAEELNE